MLGYGDQITVLTNKEMEEMAISAGLKSEKTKEFFANVGLTNSEEGLSIARLQEIATSDKEEAETAKLILAKYEEDAVNKKVAASSKLASAGVKLFSAALNMGLMIAVSAAIKGIEYLASTNERYVESLQKDIDKLNENISAYDNEIESLEQLQEKLQAAKGNREDLVAIYGDLNGAVTNATEVINGEKGAWESANEQIENNIRLLKTQRDEDIKNKISKTENAFKNNELVNDYGLDLTWDTISKMTVDGKGIKDLINEEIKEHPNTYTTDGSFIGAWKNYFEKSDQTYKFGLADPNKTEIQNFFDKQVEYAKDVYSDYLSNDNNFLKITETEFDNLLTRIIYSGNGIEDVKDILDFLFDNDELKELYDKYNESLKEGSTLDTNILKEQLLSQIEEVRKSSPELTRLLHFTVEKINSGIDKSPKKRIIDNFGDTTEQLKKSIIRMLDIKEDDIRFDKFLSDMSDNGLKALKSKLEKMPKDELKALSDSYQKEYEKELSKYPKPPKGFLSVTGEYAKMDASSWLGNKIKSLYSSPDYKDEVGTEDVENSISAKSKEWQEKISNIQEDITTILKDDVTESEIDAINKKYGIVFETIGEYYTYLTNLQKKNKSDVLALINDKIDELDPVLDADLIEKYNLAKKAIEGFYRETTSYRDEIDKSKKEISDLETILARINKGEALSKDETAELIRKYPDLASSVEIVANGYSLEAEAIQDCINTQKTSANDFISLQIRDTKVAIDEIRKRIKAYNLETKALVKAQKIGETINDPTLSGKEKLKKTLELSKSPWKEEREIITKAGYDFSQLDLYDKELEELEKLLLDNSVDIKNHKDGTDKDGTNKDKDATKDYLDWIEIKIDRIENKISKLDSTASNATKSSSTRIKAYTDEIENLQKEISIQQSGAQRYLRQANSVGLSENWASKVRNGAIDISTITDDELKTKIENYRNWYEKYQGCIDAITTLTDTKVEKQLAKIQIKIDDLQSSLSSIQAKAEKVQLGINLKETFGQTVSASLYTKQQKYQMQQIQNLGAQNKELKEQQKLVTKNSEEWNNYQEQIDSNNNSIQEQVKSMSDLALTIANLPLDTAENKNNKLEEKVNLLNDKSGILTGLRQNSLISKQNSYANQKNKNISNAYVTAVKNVPTSKKNASTNLNKLIKKSKNSTATNYAKKIYNNYISKGKEIPSGMLETLASYASNTTGTVATVLNNFLIDCANFNASLNARETAKYNVETSAVTTANNIKTNMDSIRDNKINSYSSSYNVASNNFSYTLANKNSSLYANNSQLNKEHSAYVTNRQNAYKDILYTNKNSSANNAYTSTINASKKATGNVKTALNNALTYIKKRQQVPDNILNQIAFYYPKAYANILSYNERVALYGTSLYEEVSNYAEIESQKIENKQSMFNNRLESEDMQDSLLDAKLTVAKNASDKNKLIESKIKNVNDRLGYYKNEATNANTDYNTKKRKLSGLNANNIANKTYRKYMNNIINSAKAGTQLITNDVAKIIEGYEKGLIPASFY